MTNSTNPTTSNTSPWPTDARRPMGAPGNAGWRRRVVCCLLLLAPLVGVCKPGFLNFGKKSTLYATANLGRIYERLDIQEANAEVAKLLETAGYDAKSDLLIDVGGYSAPGLVSFRSDNDSKYQEWEGYARELGALNALKNLGVDALLPGPRELLIAHGAGLVPDAEIALKTATNLQYKGAPGLPLGSQYIVDLDGEEWRAGSYLDEDAFLLPAFSQSQYDLASVESYFGGGDYLPGRYIAIEEDADGEKRPPAVADSIESGGFLISSSGDAFSFDQAFTRSEPMVMKIELNDLAMAVKRGEAPKAELTVSPDLMERLRTFDSVKFSNEVAPDMLPGSIGGNLASFSYQMAEVPSKGHAEWPLRVGYAIFTREDVPGKSWLFARAENVTQADVIEDGSTINQFSLLRQADGRYQIWLNTPFKFGGFYIKQGLFERRLGGANSAEQLRQKIKDKMPAYSDLLECFPSGIEMMEAADAQLKNAR